MSRFSVDEIVRSKEEIDPVFLNTPQFECETLSEFFECRVALKVETLNPIRSFKGRGADFLVNKTSDDRLICASAGNFGQAMAYACRKKGIALTVYASEQANPLKVDRMRGFGAEVISMGEDFDSAKLETKKAAQKAGVRFVEDSLDVETVIGAGTIGLELTNYPETIDFLLVSLGNGALINGVAKVFKKLSPQTKIIAVQSAGAPAMIESWKSNSVVTHERINTIADGIGVRIPVPEALEDLKGMVDEGLLTEEESILEAMKLIHQYAGIIVEPSGAVGIAALLENKSLFRDKTVATILCGGNLTREQINEWLG